MAIGDRRRRRIAAYDDSGAEVEFQVRVVTIGDGRLGCRAPAELARLVERDPRVRLDELGGGTAEVVRSGRTFAEVHGRLQGRVGRLSNRPRSTPVVLIRPE